MLQRALFFLAKMKKTEELDLNGIRGFSLVEVLIFISILAVFFVVAASVATYSLRVMQSNESRLLATRYAEELVEWLRGEKEQDWNQFNNKASNSPGTAWCFNADTISNFPGSSGSCAASDFSLGNPDRFKRNVVLIQDSTGGVRTNITVSWQEGSSTFSVPINTLFAPLE